jgi:hypothetical protein
MISDTKVFSKLIEKVVSDNKITYIDAIIHCSNKHGIEVEVAAKLINSKIKSIIALEASDLNLLKEKIAQLPFK